MERNVEVGEGPKEITAGNVVFWSKHAKVLEGSQSDKAQLLVKLDCVQYVGYDESLGRTAFIVLPLNTEKFWHEQINGEDRVFVKKPHSKDYNTSSYQVYRDGKRWNCNCQGWSTKEKKGEGKEDGVQCSHTLAVIFWFKLRGHKDEQ